MQLDAMEKHSNPVWGDTNPSQFENDPFDFQKL